MRLVLSVAAVTLLVTIGCSPGQESAPSVSHSQPSVGQEDSVPQPHVRRPRDLEKVHDPSTIINVEGTYRFFATGHGISLMRETANRMKWLPDGRLFQAEELPRWHQEVVPDNKGHLWAPDVIRLGKSYFVYYSVSTFGKNTSAIGLAVGSTLNPKSPNWKWEDRGLVVASKQMDRYNAIDPAIFRDDDGSLWMTFGSFWDGLHLIELDRNTGLRLNPGLAPDCLASAPEIEAPFLHKRNGYYYLFINWGKCCRGVESTYDIRVERSERIAGPYLDHEGKDLRERGGTVVLASEGRFIGPGHASILRRDGAEWLAHHYYDGENRGRSRHRLVPLLWSEDGWPRVDI